MDGYALRRRRTNIMVAIARTAPPANRMISGSLDSGCSPVAGRLPRVIRTVAEAVRTLRSPSVRFATLMASTGTGASARTRVTIRITTTSPGFSVPITNWTLLPVMVYVPFVVEALRTVKYWFGIWSSTTTLVAAAVPRFVAVRVNVTTSPGSARLTSASFVIAGSTTNTAAVDVAGTPAVDVADGVNVAVRQFAVLRATSVPAGL